MAQIVFTGNPPGQIKRDDVGRIHAQLMACQAAGNGDELDARFAGRGSYVIVQRRLRA